MLGDDPLFRLRRIRANEETDLRIGNSFSKLVIACFVVIGMFVTVMVTGGPNFDLLMALLRSLMKLL